MSDVVDRWTEAVGKLIALTQFGKLEWKVGEPEEAMKEHPDDRVDSVYLAEYQGRPLRLYRLGRLRRLSAMEQMMGSPGLASTPPDTHRMHFRTHLQLGRSLEEGGWWSFPDSSAIPDLLNAVKYQVAGVNDFLDAILNEPVE